MSKRYFGLDIGPRQTRLTVLDYQKGQLARVHFLASNRETLAEQMNELRKDVGDLRFGDRMAAALPAQKAYVRQLAFPFRDAKKIAAALPFEMNAEIPVPADDCAIASQPPVAEGDGAKVTAAAVPKPAVQEVLDAADETGLPLHILDLSPFAYLAGLDQLLAEGILVASTQRELTVSAIQHGNLTDYRLLPAAENRDYNRLAALIAREIRGLQAKTASRESTIYLLGEEAQTALTAPLQQQGFPVEQLVLNLAGEEVPPDFAPATALALRAAARPEKSFNFRQGSYALKGEWQKLKKSLVAATCVAVLSLLVLTAAAFVNYQAKARQAEALERQMTLLFQEAFPGSRAIADIPMQVQSMLVEMRERSRLIGGRQPDVLAVLKATSDLPDDLEIDVEEFSYGPGEVRISGRAGSFDAVNRITERLAASELFASVQIADAKMALEGNRVNFRLLLTLAGEGNRS